MHKPARPSRHIPRKVKRAVWQRDGGQCAFVSTTGQRCTEHNFLELHHVWPYAMQGPASVANVSLRCRRHNQYEAELIFGPHDVSVVREGPELFVPGPCGGSAAGGQRFVARVWRSLGKS